MSGEARTWEETPERTSAGAVRQPAEFSSKPSSRRKKSSKATNNTLSNERPADSGPSQNFDRRVSDIHLEICTRGRGRSSENEHPQPHELHCFRLGSPLEAPQLWKSKACDYEQGCWWSYAQAQWPELAQKRRRRALSQLVTGPAPFYLMPIITTRSVRTHCYALDLALSV